MIQLNGNFSTAKVEELQASNSLNLKFCSFRYKPWLLCAAQKDGLHICCALDAEIMFRLMIIN